MRTMRFLILSSALLLMAVTSPAQNYKLYTVFMNSFTRYIEWPAELNVGDFEIYVLGESPIVSELKNMAEIKKVGDRTIKITQIKSVSEIRKCNILFVPSDKSGLLGDVLTKLGPSSTLVVTEQEGLGQKGSGINFVEKSGKPTFELNNAALGKAKLKASSELSRIAIII
ncbi:MAG: DUF4154 domain-containing protein [Azospira oryzae]|jgi:hypothetical protein|nr:MAG: DUF4154 domain-containing protein [Azospira oryzae]